MTLLILRGLPASGKTTFALQLLKSDSSYVRVNKDDIRAELEATGWTWTHKNEEKVIAIRDGRIETALASGVNVISDDTNLSKRHEARLRELAAKYHGSVELRTFNTPLEECIVRDAKREGRAKVGEVVIRRMAAQQSHHKDAPLQLCANCLERSL